MCVCVREREREKESVCVCVCVRARACVCVRARVWVGRAYVYVHARECVSSACNTGYLQCVAVRCSVLQCVAVSTRIPMLFCNVFGSYLCLPLWSGTISRLHKFSGLFLAKESHKNRGFAKSNMSILGA